MEVIYRCNKRYLAGNISYGGGIGDPEGAKNFKTAVEFWDKTFNLDFFTIRERMRSISYEILINQSCIKKINKSRPTQYRDNVYAPMDDDIYS